MKRLAYTVAETAEVLGTSESSVRRAIHAGRIPAYRLTERVLRVPAKALEEQLNGLAPRHDRAEGNPTPSGDNPRS